MGSLDDEGNNVFAAPLGRRRLLQAGALGGVGLAAAALIGCGDDDDDDDDDTGGGGTASPTSEGGAAEQELINADLVALNDPDLPFPWVIPEPALEPRSGGTFVIGNDQDIAGFDPALSTSGTVTTMPSMGYDRLLSFVDGPFLHPFKVPDLEAKLAREWEVTPDGLTYTFTITDQAKFHNKPPLDGRALVANDIKLVLDRYRTEGVHTANYSFVDSIDAPDDTTLVITMTDPNPDFLVPFGSRYQPIYPMELFDQGLLQTEVIGTGPFIMEEAVKSDHVFHAKNPDYWDAPVYLDRVEFRIVPDSATRLAGLRTGQYHYAPQTLPNFTAAQALAESNPDQQIWIADDGAPVYHFALNLTNPKFQDARVRQALMMLLDRETMNEVLYQGYAEQSAVLPWFFAFDEKPTPDSGLGPWWRYDPDEATKLLTAAGAEGLSIDLVWSSEDAQVEFLIDQMGEGGVTVNGEQLDFTSLAATWNKRDFAEGAFGYSTGGFTADSRFRGQLLPESEINRWHIDDAEITDWANQQATMLDPEARREVLRQIWDKVLAEAYRVETLLPLRFNAVAPGVRNFRTYAPLSSVSGILGFGDWAPRVWLES